jgi:hypothetical protein
MSVRCPEVDHLLEVLRPTLERFVTAAKRSKGDFGEVEEAGVSACSAMRRALMSAGLEASALAAADDFACPCCAARLARQSERERTIVTKLGEASYRSVRWRCGKCQQDHYPLEEANGVHGNQFTTKAQGLIASFTAALPYAHASRLLAQMGIPVSTREADRTAQEVSGWRKAEEVAAIRRAFPDGDDLSVEEVASLHDWTGWGNEDVVVISADGGKVRSPERGEDGLKWFECRVGVIASANEESRARKLYVGGVMEADALFDLLATAWRSHPDRRVKVLFISDGAEWIWRRVQLYFPGAIEVVDIFHASEHVASAAIARWGENSRQAKEWRAHAREMLMADDGPKRVRRKLIREYLSGKSAEPEQLRKHIRYLFRHRRRMPYRALAQQGLPIGSGVIESAVKQVNTARLRLPGMKWTRPGADNMLRLRSALLSDALHDTVGRRHTSLMQLAQRYKPNHQPMAA